MGSGSYRQKGLLAQYIQGLILRKLSRCMPSPGGPRVIMRESSNLVGSDIPSTSIKEVQLSLYVFFGLSPNSFKVFCQAFLSITDHIQHLHLHLYPLQSHTSLWFQLPRATELIQKVLRSWSIFQPRLYTGATREIHESRYSGTPQTNYMDSPLVVLMSSQWKRLAWREGEVTVT